MNIIDIIIIVCFAISIIFGFKDGVIRQIGSLLSIVVAIFVAKNFGSTVSSFLGIGGDNAALWGYLIVFVLCLVGVGFVASLLRKIISAVGLGIIDRVAGGVLGFIICAIMLSLIFSLFNLANSSFGFVDQKTIDESKLYTPVVSTSKYIMPTVNWVEEQLPLEAKEEKK